MVNYLMALHLLFSTFSSDAGIHRSLQKERGNRGSMWSENTLSWKLERVFGFIPQALRQGVGSFGCGPMTGFSHGPTFWRNPDAVWKEAWLGPAFGGGRYGVEGLVE